MARTFLSILTCLLLSKEASGDGGAVRLKETSGPFVITVFTAPEPLQVGSADVSVLVQDRRDGEPILDADVSVQLSPPASSDIRPLVTAAATRSQAINKLLYASVTNLTAPGTWMLRVSVRHGTGSADVDADVSVAPRVSGLRMVWPYLLVPPAVILLFALHQSLARRRVWEQ